MMMGEAKAGGVPAAREKEEITVKNRRRRTAVGTIRGYQLPISARRPEGKGERKEE